MQNSGQGGRFILPDVNITAPGGEFGSIPVGAPYFGHDVNDTGICESAALLCYFAFACSPKAGYFNGTPGATAVFGIDVIAPMHFENGTIDLVVAGPNEGGNAGSWLYTLSGTMGATYHSVYRGVCTRHRSHDCRSSNMKYFNSDPSHRFLCRKRNPPVFHDAH